MAINYQAWISHCLRDAGRRYRAGHLSQCQIEHTAQRADRLRRRADTLDTLRLQRTRQSRFDRSMERLHQVVSSGGRVVAIDTGFASVGASDPDDTGVAVLTQYGIFVETFVVPGQPHRVLQNQAFGPVSILPIPLLRAKVQDLYDQADVVVFHSIHQDQRVLGLKTLHTPWVDTSLNPFVPQPPALDVLRRRYGLFQHFDAHPPSAVDARDTLLIALCMMAERLTLPVPTAVLHARSCTAMAA